MGTTLTGTTPQDTYDSLIKVTDNGPLSGSLKKLTDGLGNDSSLSLSTTAASFSGTLAVSGATTLAAATVTSVSARNSGIPAIEAFRDLDVTVVGSAGQGIEFGAKDGSTYKAGSAIYGGLDNPSTTGNIVFQTRTADALTTKMTITSAGSVGIGTSSPAATLEVKSGTSGFRSITSDATSATFSMLTDLGLGYDNAAQLIAGQTSTNNAHLIFATKTSGSITEKVRILASGGITFNGDTAAANALDDYEEGTFNFVVAFGGSDTGITYNNRLGTYTKIGRQVTCQGWIRLSSKGSATGNATIAGLPFTIGAGAQFYNGGSIGYIGDISFADQISAYSLQGQNGYELVETTNAGVLSSITDANFANNSEIMVSFTYFV